MKRVMRFLFFILLISNISLYCQFAGGSGTVGDPYQVATAEHLNNVRNYLSAYFIQTADIDLGVSPWNVDPGWDPIGNFDSYNVESFKGNFKGNGFKIRNLTINRPGESNVGLFGFTSNACLEKIAVENVNVNGGTGTGGLLGYNWNGSAVINCYSTGMVQGSLYAGGLVGQSNNSALISASYSSCTVIGLEKIGGLLGSFDFGAVIVDCYALGNVTGMVDCAGGLIGYIHVNEPVILENCYSKGLVTGPATNKGGLIGRDGRLRPFPNCYWDVITSGQPTSSGGVPKVTPEMQNPATYIGWDFTTPVWRMEFDQNGGYPYLSWQSMPRALNLIANPAGGGTVTGDGSYTAGTSVPVNATANYGYKFINWTNSVNDTLSSVPGFSYVMPDNNVALTANFGLNFSEVIGTGFPNVAESTTAWGDYDNDGDLDALIIGWNGLSREAKIFKNNGSGTFADIGFIFNGARYSAAAWGDYNNDGYLDFATTGWEVGGIISKIYRNNANDTFTDISAGLLGVNSGSVTWGDYDNDGDLDLLISGWYSSGSTRIMKLYKNTNGSFSDSGQTFEGLEYSSLAWGDYDKDGDLDILACGNNNSKTAVTKIYNNSDGAFTDAGAGLPGVSQGSVAWGDYNYDGDLDILLTGNASTGRISKVFKNIDGVFSDINAVLPGVSLSSSAWCDFDNDETLDIIISGDSGAGYITKIYGISSDTVTEKSILMKGVDWGYLGCGDYDNDGDVDLLLSGNIDSKGGTIATKLYKNNCSIPNDIPLAPTGFTISGNLQNAVFSFAPDYESKRPLESYSFNIDISIAGVKVKPAMADLTNGYRRIPQTGNLNFGNTSSIKGPPIGGSWNLKYKVPATVMPQELMRVDAAVQAIDMCLAGSPFATQTANLANRDLLTITQELMTGTDELVWEHIMSDSLNYYILQLSSDQFFVTYYEQMIALTKDSKTVYIGGALNQFSFYGDLIDNTIYYWRVKPVHINPDKETVFKTIPDSFIYNYQLPVPMDVAVTNVEGNYVTLTWNTLAKDAKLDVRYSVYSSELPYASFPTGWTLEASGLGSTTCVIRSTTAKKFFVVTSNNNLK